MNSASLTFRPLQPEDARAILQWRYPAPHDVYNFDPANQRARKVWERLGFQPVSEFVQQDSGRRFVIMMSERRERWGNLRIG